MNKQELIDKYEAAECVVNFVSGKTLLKTILRDLKQLDEQKPVKVPQFVADWIERSKQEKRNLRNALNNGGEKMRLWFLDQENYDLFAQAWLTDYEVDEEKRYRVKIKGEIKENLLVYGLGIERYFFAKTYDSSKRGEHTRKELEEADFGWIFDCPGIEIEEVE